MSTAPTAIINNLASQKDRIDDPASHLSLLALQFKGNHMDVDEDADAWEHLLSGSDENTNNSNHKPTNGNVQ